jgi:hypothetical protein
MIEHSNKPDMHIRGHPVGLANVHGPGTHAIAWVPLRGVLCVLCISKDLTPDHSRCTPITDFSHSYWDYFKECGYLNDLAAHKEKTDDRH